MEWSTKVEWSFGSGAGFGGVEYSQTGPKIPPLVLVHGQDVVLPIEVNLDAYKSAKQNNLSSIDYHDLMMDNIDEVADKCLKALKKIEKDKF